ncbi:MULTISPECIES: nucleotide exchange factor GrpE [unclassified Breznakia]|uniref:nucleotide exchange factor GrpE n=1 Tax=unclassified Breznakia TaxID=2623764 RepID=UPI002472F6A5|nr:MULTISPECIES: nucleotide exchange factor GrpE [unclassified Breznakia]MDH6367442.1 molecular chaperone GrpE [Breznakia sp. PH1-1]MDH6404585.1 molecular chaperone GrpE [Breznakia sp. PF1-11]MDH6412294.1 molecular chaperone GrpE [Breznakia sp. PFB1-11]MDH6414609.1 molecular chaperone GrpE [Breznakia sp. PFB1-14]MDH6416980.1 molecular chaperone GrpE [Breznakia sp. PFB1-4]
MSEELNKEEATLQEEEVLETEANEQEEMLDNEEAVETQEHEELEEGEKKEKKGFFKKKKSKEEALEEEIIGLREELAKTQNMYYKAYADTENLKKRLQNDADTLRKYRIQSFAQEILPVMDNLERAIGFEAKDEDVKNYVNGINMVYQQIKIALENEGVKAIECLDKPFDPNIHQALVTEKAEGAEPGIVLEEIQKGYMLKDRVIRASLVKVSE